MSVLKKINHALFFISANPIPLLLNQRPMNDLGDQTFFESLKEGDYVDFEALSSCEGVNRGQVARFVVDWVQCAPGRTLIGFRAVNGSVSFSIPSWDVVGDVLWSLEPVLMKYKMKRIRSRVLSVFLY